MKNSGKIHIFYRSNGYFRPLRLLFKSPHIVTIKKISYDDPNVIYLMPMDYHWLRTPEGEKWLIYKKHEKASHRALKLIRIHKNSREM